MATTTLLQLRTRIRQRADLVGSDFVTDTELNDLINTAYKELYAHLVAKSLNRTETSYAVPITGAASYALPADFYSLIGVYRTEGLDKLRLTRYSDTFQPSTRTGDACEYRVVGSNLALHPVPTGGTYTLVYIPVAPVLATDADTVNGVLGWEEFIVLDVAICCLEKEESDTSKLEYKRDRILKRIADEANAIEFTETVRIRNTRDDSSFTDPASIFNYRSADDWGL
jgi:hypothetical protein